MSVKKITRKLVLKDKEVKSAKAKKVKGGAPPERKVGLGMSWGM